MNPRRFSTLAHARHRICHPLSPETVDAALERITVPPAALAFDAGCGKGEMLLRLVRRAGAKGVGVDLNAEFLEEARAATAARPGPGSLEWREQDATAFAAAESDGAYHVTMCVGSTHAFGTLGDTLRALARLTRRGGYMLAGEGYWRRPPESGYLAALGDVAGDLTSHAENFARGKEQGFEPLWNAEATPTDWDAYEGLYADSIERFAAAHPEDPDRDAMLERIRAWRDTYSRWGRDTLGFGLYLFRQSTS